VLESLYRCGGRIRRLCDRLTTEFPEASVGVFSELSATSEGTQLVGMSSECLRHGARRSPLVGDLGRAVLFKIERRRRRVNVVRVATTCHGDVQLLGVGPIIDNTWASSTVAPCARLIVDA
jgi:hypothetical protein